MLTIGKEILPQNIEKAEYKISGTIAEVDIRGDSSCNLVILGGGSAAFAAALIKT